MTKSLVLSTHNTLESQKVFHSNGEEVIVYSAIEHLARSVCPNECLEHSFMAMITVYFDDSGTHPDSDIAVAACFVSDVVRWNAFESKWRSILESAGISDCGFHMADFNSRQGRFKDWNEEKRQEVHKTIIEAINENAQEGMASAVIKADYDAFITGKLREKLGRFHYTFAVLSCLAFIEEWRQHKNITAPIQYVFDQMNKGKQEITNLFDDIARRKTAVAFGVEPGGYAFQNRKTVVQLQASDILAWEANKYMRDSQFGGKAPRASFQSLVDNIKIRARFFDKQSFPGFICEVSRRYDKSGWDDAPLGGLLT